MGKMALADLSGRMDIPAVFDRSVKSETSISICKKVNNHMEKETVFEYPFRHPDSIPEDETIILITPADIQTAVLVFEPAAILWDVRSDGVKEPAAKEGFGQTVCSEKRVFDYRGAI